MTKKEWEEIRDKEELPFSLYYQYYLENKDPKKNLLSIEDFTVAFQNYIYHGQGKAIQTDKGIRHINFNSMLEKMYKYFNKKFS